MVKDSRGRSEVRYRTGASEWAQKSGKQVQSHREVRREVKEECDKIWVAGKGRGLGDPITHLRLRCGTEKREPWRA